MMIMKKIDRRILLSYALKTIRLRKRMLLMKVILYGSKEMFFMKLEEKFVAQYFDVIENKRNTENQIQEFLEENTIFIPTPFLLNHHLHMNCVISKFKLGNEFVTDFAYLTKSSDYWEFVLVELEDAKKKIFTKDKENIYFHSEFNHAYDQIMSWKAYVNKNREAILHQIDKLRVPLNENSVRFKYVLVIGRNSEKNNSEKRRAMFAEKSDNDIRVMTYDSLVSQCESVSYNDEKIILSTWKEQGFKIKKLPKQEIHTSLFAYIKPEYLKISERDIKILKAQDYQIDSWLSGKMLRYNEKYDMEFLKEKTANPLINAALYDEKKIK